MTEKRDDGLVMELGLDTLCYHRAIRAEGLRVEDVLEAGAALGVSWVRVQRIHLGGDETRARLNALGQRARGHGLRLIWSGDSLGEASWLLEVGLNRIRTGIEQAVTVGAPLLRMFPSWFRTDAAAIGTVAQECAYLRALLTAAVPFLEREGLVLALENHSNLTANEMAEVIAAVASPCVRIHLDLVNPIALFEDPVMAIRRMAPYAVACDVKDLVVESEWASGQYHRTGFRVRYTWPGEGIFPLTEALTVLRSTAGSASIPLIIEGLDETAQPTEKAQRSLAVLRRVMKQISALAAEGAVGQPRRAEGLG